MAVVSASFVMLAGMPEAGLGAKSYVIGVDEAGRGPLAGPVVAAAVVLCRPCVPGLDDSKKLTREQRAVLEPRIRRRCAFGIGVVEVEDIDRINIFQATMMAMTEAMATATEVMILIGTELEPTGDWTSGSHLRGTVVCRIQSPVLRGRGAMSGAGRDDRPRAKPSSVARMPSVAGLGLVLRVAIAMRVVDERLVTAVAAEVERPTLVLFRGGGVLWTDHHAADRILDHSQLRLGCLVPATATGGMIVMRMVGHGRFHCAISA